MKRSSVLCLLAFSIVSLCQFDRVSAEEVKRPVSAQQVVEQNGKDGKYTFLIFHREDNDAFRSMSKTVRDHVAKKADLATVTAVRITDPAAKSLVDRFDVSRAPMPLMVAVAPNGAMTAMLQNGMTEQDLAEAFVTPTMLKCMKSLQEKKLVMVCVHAGESSAMPKSVKEFISDEHYKDRTVVYSMKLNDPAEKKLLGQMQIDPKGTKGTLIVFLAPPGVMIGKFDAATTMDVMAGALHKAGKCCDDPNCKHNHAPQASQPGQQRR